EEGKVVKDMILFSINGQAHGDFKTETVAPGMYTIRAFTKFIGDFGEEACFHKKIWISKLMKTVDRIDNDMPDYSKIDVAFLPEGGNLLLNAINTVAFKAIDIKGKGISISGKILNDRGDTITSFVTDYLGMGKFVMMPQDETNYYAAIDQVPGLKIELPKAIEKGISLNYKENGESLMFELSANMKLDNYPGFYFVASHKGVVLFYQKIGMVDYAQSVKVSKNLFPRGISKITLLDTALVPMAERLVFVDDGNDVLQLQINQKEFNPREEVKIDLEALLSPGDSINSPLSVSVVNKNYFSAGGNSQTIKSYLLLDSDLKGAIESPASYFVDDNQISSAEKIDLLMMVHGWKSYLWDDIDANPTPPVDDWNDAGITIKGLVKKLLWQAPVADAKVVLGPTGGNMLFVETTSDEKGRFEFKQIYLRDSTNVMINATTKNGTRNTEIRLDPVFKLDSIVSATSLKNTTFDIDLTQKFNVDNSYRRMKEMGFNPEKGSILLSDVDVIERKIIKDDGHFRIYSDPDNSFTITKNDNFYNNVLDYLEGKVAGLVISGDQISIRGGKQPLFLVDGIEVSDFPPESGSALREIRNIHMAEIDKVEILKSGVNMAIFGSRGADGVISIYRKTGELGKSNDNYVRGRISQQIKGFNRKQKFYSPKYTIENIQNPQPDFRPTLYWNPELNFVNSKSNIGFFTSDETAQYVVFVEGISKNGKICFGTTGFSVNKK
ncbi:MAG TPA: TonB-dependent receptor plug domain-containing protein, partial [Prolixibacteraceae bacterium]